MKKRRYKVTGGTKWWRCNNCNDWKLPSNYGKRSEFTSGLSGRCKDCDILVGFTERQAKSRNVYISKNAQVAKDMTAKRLGLMKEYKDGGDSSLSYSEFDDIPDITDITRNKK